MFNSHIEILKQFDFSILNDLDYKEDAMREDLLTPLLRTLGYTNSGENKLVRTKSLKHPFFHLGTKKMEITLIPDYLLEIKGKVKCVIEAKSPCIDISGTQIIGQVYSYAFHPEVMSEYFGLCNGKEIVIYKNNSSQPIFKETMIDIIMGSKWDELHHLLSVQSFTKPHTINLKNQNVISEISLKATTHFLNWAKPNDDLYIDEFVAFIIGFPIIDLSWRIGFELSTDEIFQSISNGELEIQINERLSQLRDAGFTTSKKPLTPDLLKSYVNQYAATYFLDRQEDNWTYLATRNKCLNKMINADNKNDKDGFLGLMESIINRMRGRVKKNLVL